MGWLGVWGGDGLTGLVWWSVNCPTRSRDSSREMMAFNSLQSRLPSGATAGSSVVIIMWGLSAAKGGSDSYLSLP